MECDFGLLDQLIQDRVLDDKIEGKLRWSNLSSYEQNELLLNYLCSEDFKAENLYKLRRFVQALSFTMQLHIALLLLGNVII